VATILLGEDDPDIRELVTYKLQQVGHSTGGTRFLKLGLRCRFPPNDHGARYRTPLPRKTGKP
jgi:hypothetical protein